VSVFRKRCASYRIPLLATMRFVRLLCVLMLQPAAPEDAEACNSGPFPSSCIQNSQTFLQIGTKSNSLNHDLALLQTRTRSSNTEKRLWQTSSDKTSQENEEMSLPQMTVHDVEHDDEISRAKKKWVSSGQRGSIAELPPSKQWPFNCAEAQKVCFIQNELVALEASATDASDKPRWANESGASFWDLPDEHPLSFFGEQRVVFNIPGYFDGLDQVQRTVRPTRVRPASRTMESVSVWDAPLLNVTPLVVYPTWPFNFGDTLGSQFFHGYVDWASQHPEMYNLPLAVALPHNFLLPSFWRLLNGMGLGVESFSLLSAATHDEPPLCFKKIIGCSQFGPRETWREALSKDSPKAWEAFRKTVVGDMCPSDLASLSKNAREQRVVVGFVQRTKARQLRNLKDMLKQCDALGTLGGKRIECRKVEFSDVLKDVCQLQDLDVIVGTHGAQLANAHLMRPGSSLIEVRAKDWYAVDSDGRLKDPDSWTSTIAQSLWYTNNTRYWWYGADAEDSFPDTRSKVPGRDSDVVMQWPTLACMMEKVILFGTEHEAYRNSDIPMLRNAGCSMRES